MDLVLVLVSINLRGGPRESGNGRRARGGELHDIELCSTVFFNAEAYSCGTTCLPTLPTDFMAMPESRVRTHIDGTPDDAVVLQQKNYLLFENNDLKLSSVVLTRSCAAAAGPVKYSVQRRIQAFHATSWKHLAPRFTPKDPSR